MKKFVTDHIAVIVVAVAVISLYTLYLVKNGSKPAAATALQDAPAPESEE